MADLSGTCLCGAVRWSAPGPMLWAGHCHCDSCRRATGAPFASFFGVGRTSVTWTGELGERVTSKGSVRRQFCRQCGTQLTYQSTAWRDETHLYASTLDDPSLFRPEAHFHYAERLPWIAVDLHLPKFDGTADNSDPTP